MMCSFDFSQRKSVVSSSMFVFGVCIFALVVFSLSPFKVNISFQQRMIAVLTALLWCLFVLFAHMQEAFVACAVGYNLYVGVIHIKFKVRTHILFIGGRCLKS